MSVRSSEKALPTPGADRPSPAVPAEDSPAALAACLALCLHCGERPAAAALAVLARLRLHEGLGLDEACWQALLARAGEAAAANPDADQDAEAVDTLLRRLRSPTLRRIALSAGTAVCMADRRLSRREAALLLRMRQLWQVEPDLLATVRPERGIRLEAERRASLPDAYKRHLRKKPWWQRFFGS